MFRKAIAIALLVLALIATCAVSAWVVLFTARLAEDRLERGDIHIGLFERADVSAEIVETREYRLGTPSALEIETDAGDIEVRAGDVDEIQVTMTRRGWGGDRAGALAAAQALTVTETARAGGVSLTYRQPERVVVGGSRGGTDAVSFAVTVPSATDATLLARFGDVRLEGTRRPAHLTSSFGDVVAVDLHGALTAQSDAGDVRAEGIDAGAGDITLGTQFGGITAEGVEGRTFTGRSTNGAVVATGLAISDTIAVESNFGSLRVVDVRGASITADTDNGAVTIERARLTGRATVDTRFGQVTLREVTASAIEVRSQGEMTLETVAGALDLESRFGDIEVRDASRAVADIETTNGALVFSGTLDPRSAHEFRSSFGDITLELPASSNFDVDLQTDFGTIESALPVTLAGELAKDHWRGRVGAGGPQVIVVTKNGDIDLRTLIRR